MNSKVACKLRVKPTTTGATAPRRDRKSTRATQPTTKEEAQLAEGITTTLIGEPLSKALVFQQLRSTDIAPSATAGSTFVKQEPKREPSLNTNSPRPSRPDLIILDADEPVVPKKEEPLIKSSERCTDSDVIVLDSDDEAVTRPVAAASNAASVVQPPSDDSDTEVVKRRGKSDSRGANRREHALRQVPSAEGADLQDDGNEVKCTLAKYLRIIASSARGEASNTRQEIQGSTGPSRGESGACENAAQPLAHNADPKRPNSSIQIYPRGESSVRQEQTDGPRIKQEDMDDSSQKRKRLVAKPPQPEFDTDLPSDWFVDSPRDTHNEINGSTHPTPLPQPDVRAEMQDSRSRARRSERLVPFCASHREGEANDTRGKDTLAQRSTPQKELSLTVKRSSVPQIKDDQKRLREQWRKYWIVDQQRNGNGKRGRSERETPTEAGMEEHILGSSLGVSGIDAETDEESDVNPDEVNFSPTHRQKRKSQGTTQRAEKDREARAHRRAAEAEGADVPWSEMVDRKPRIEEHKRNVVIKVREVRKNLEYSFVKPRKEPFRDLREELQLYAELPRNVKFELKYRNKVIKDTDTPESLGILYTGRVGAVRRERPDDDSSDGVAEVERKRRRENLIKVTVQDEKGKKHTFQHDKKLKFHSLFHAFAKMCQNDIRGYRFFFDGKRLSYDDRPIDCEDFEDGALIDAFFETTGGGTR